ncbi:MAG: acyltransferase [Paenibacillus sp.]|nr:acyltransferase [Paenibacillus sp.]
MSKPKLLELDIVRGIAIAAVLLIHATASSRVELPLGSYSHTLYFSINNLSYFPVQAFVLLSGLVLFYSYFDNWNVRRTLGFYRKRLQYILIPYLIWSCFYYLYDKWLNPEMTVTFSWPEFVRLLPWGEAGYHLYFMAIIMQLYAIFPLLISLIKLWRPLASYLWLIGIVAQAAFSFYTQYAHIAVPHGDRLFSTYFALFCIGGSIGMHYEKVMGWLNRNIWWFFAATVATGFTFLLLSLQAQYGTELPSWAFELLFNGYPAMVAISFTWIGRHWLTAAPRWSAALASLGAASFGIYFTHPSLLGIYALKTSGIVPGTWEYHAALWGSIALIVIVPWAIVSSMKRVKAAWVLFGK